MKNSQKLTSAYQKITILFLVLMCAISLSAKERIVLGLTGTVFKDDLKNFMDWEKDTLEIEENPYIRIIAVVTGVR